MKPVEQAIFTSVETDRQSGCQVVASSPGVCNADVCELAIWKPSRDSMHDTGADAESFNFHPLPSGAYCLSHTTATGWEHGGGPRSLHALPDCAPGGFGSLCQRPVRPLAGDFGARLVAAAKRAMPAFGLHLAA